MLSILLAPEHDLAHNFESMDILIDRGMADDFKPAVKEQS